MRGLIMCAPARLAMLASALAAGSFVLGLLSQLAFAHDVKPPEQPTCTCPNPGPNPSKPPAVSAKPKFAETNAHLDENDEIAALEAIRVALTEVGDGGTYVWHRQHGRLSGIVQPTLRFLLKTTPQQPPGGRWRVGR